MDGLSSLLQAFSEAVSPIIDFLKWIFPIKFYRIRDGERAVILTLGKVRRKKAEKQAGLIICFFCEEVIKVQSKGGYIDLAEQVVYTKDYKIVTVNGAIEYEILSVKNAILEAENIEALIEGICSNEIREYARKQDFEKIADSGKLTEGLATKVNKKLSKYGVKVETLMLTDLRPHSVTMICDTIDRSIGSFVKALLPKEK